MFQTIGLYRDTYCSMTPEVLMQYNLVNKIFITIQNLIFTIVFKGEITLCNNSPEVLTQLFTFHRIRYTKRKRDRRKKKRKRKKTRKKKKKLWYPVRWNSFLNYLFYSKSGPEVQPIVQFFSSRNDFLVFSSLLLIFVVLVYFTSTH